MIAVNEVKPGRPEKYGAAHVRLFKEIVRQMGLRKGCEFLREKGIKINNKIRKLNISAVTLSKYVRRDDELTGEPVVLRRGRPEVNNFVLPDNEVEKAFSSTSKKMPAKKKTKNLVAPGRRGRPKKSA